jgi:hypothetical protein
MAQQTSSVTSLPAAAETRASPPLPVARVLFLGFAIASIGGPLALPSLFPSAAGSGLDAAGRVLVLGLVAFAAPLWIWVAYSRRVASAGGLTAFVALDAGRRAAVAHGWIWALAYFLYIPYTVTYVVYDVLPPVFPGLVPYRAALELTLPVAIVLVVLAPLRPVLAGIAVLAAVQLGLLLALAGVELAHAGAARPAAPAAGVVARAGGGVALLFVCVSLPLYLGGEAAGGSRTVRRGLVAAVAVVGAAFLLAGAPFTRVPAELRNAAVPGAAIAQAYGGRGFGVAVGLGTAASMVILIVAEYLALGRLIHWLHGVPVRTAFQWIAVPFVALAAMSLINPDRFYNDMLEPSLVALYVSLLAVFILFPRRRRTPLSLGAAAVASTLAVYGIYTVFAGAP